MDLFHIPHLQFAWLVNASTIAGVVSVLFTARGGWIGARFARRLSGNVLRRVVVTTGCVRAGHLFRRNAHV